MFFAPSGFDEFIVEPTALVTATAPTAITFNTGFHVKAGASFSAKITNGNGGRVSNNVVSTTTPINYAITSNHANTKHLYVSWVQNKIIPTNVEQSTTSLFSVYPTVSNGIFKIANESLNTYKVEVINSMGQVVIMQTQNLQQIDITNKANGFYFVRIGSDNKSHIFKVLKE